MNAKDFLSITDTALIHAIQPDNYPSFSAVLTVLNKNLQHHFHKLLPPANNIQEALFLLLHNLKTSPVCECGKSTTFKTIGQGYSTYCSGACRGKSELVKQKREQTNLTKFGFKNAGQAASTKDKIASTNISRYGCPSVLAVPSIIQQSKHTKKTAQQAITYKTMQTNFKKYGVPCTLNDETIKEKARKTLLEKYGVEHNSQIPDVKEKKREQLFSYRKKSIFEDEVVNAIHQLGYTGLIIRNIRSLIKPMEIDIWLPDINLAIECNGCYWHSDPHKPKDYHLIKTDAVEKIGAKLIQLLDFEWINKNDIVLHRLRSALGLSQKIYARKCQVKKISLNEANVLISAYHIQGPALAKINYGLYYENELVAVMNFSKPRFSKKYEYELIRYASSVNVVGGAGKLLAAFNKEFFPKSIVTYADRRWSNGNLYRKIGFVQTHESGPGYWYFKGNQFKHRAVFQKHKLKELLPIFNEQLGEVENMYANGWRRIFDSGNRVYVLLDTANRSSGNAFT